MDYTAHDANNHRTLSIEPYRRRDVMDFQHQIHSMETEAYSSILKAFIAQSDLLTWGKEGLMTELRKELNVTDVEHGEILMRINSDELIKWIRDQRKLSSHAKDHVKISTPGGSSASMGNSTITLKTPSSAALYPQKTVSRSVFSLTSIGIPSPVPQKFNEDRLTAESSHWNKDQSMGMVNYNVKLPPISRGRPPKGKHQLKKDFHKPECVKIKNGSDLIAIPATDRIIHDVEEMLFSKEKPDPVDIERAKMTLREQERAILQALNKVANVLDKDGSTRPYDVPKDASAGQAMMISGNYCGPFGRMNGLAIRSDSCHQGDDDFFMA